MSNPIAANRAYGAAQALQQTTMPLSGTAPVNGGFGDQLAQVLGQATRDISAFDQKSTQLATGKADLVEVVQVIQNAETALETVVALRDKVVQAYEEVMRMTI